MPEYSAVTVFYKYQGLGNHFVVLDRRSEATEPLAPEVVRELCDVHCGVGADGILTVSAEVDGTPRMHVQNADGSDAGMCGNGLRCVARFLVDEGEAPGEIDIWVGDQLYRCVCPPEGEVSVGMGRGLRKHEELPSGSGTGVELTFEVEGTPFSGTCHFFGNPHFSVFVPQETDPMEQALRWGAALESHPAFSNRVNVSFSRSIEGGFETVVYERGVGITRACGSGACAVGAAAVLRGYWESGRPMVVSLPGGPLTITVDESWQVTMQGGAERVFEGRLCVR